RPGFFRLRPSGRRAAASTRRAAGRSCRGSPRPEHQSRRATFIRRESPPLMDETQHDRRKFLRVAGAGTAFTALQHDMARAASQTSTSRATSGSGDLCFKSAQELASLIRTRKLSAREVMAAHLERIKQVNPTVNAIVAKLDDEQCLRQAEAAD